MYLPLLEKVSRKNRAATWKRKQDKNRLVSLEIVQYIKHESGSKQMQSKYKVTVNTSVI